MLPRRSLRRLTSSRKVLTRTSQGQRRGRRGLSPSTRGPSSRSIDEEHLIVEGEDIFGVAEGYKHKTHRSHNPRATTWCPYKGDRSGKAKSTKVARQTQRTRVSPWHCFISPGSYGTDLKILNHLSFGSAPC